MDGRGLRAAPDVWRRSKVTIERISGEFSVCKLADYSGIDLARPFVFTGSTDRERSLVCPTEFAPAETLAREDGWRALRVAGQLEFSLIGILAKLSAALAEAGVGLFAISTFDTDYILVKGKDYGRAIAALTGCGCEMAN